MVIILAVGIVIILFVHLSPSHRAESSIQAVVSPATPSATFHSAQWYVAHPSVLKADEQRCAGDASTMTQAACQNVASADVQLAGADYAKAAAALNAESSADKTSAPKSP
jgi:hypothetical protein